MDREQQINDLEMQQSALLDSDGCWIFFSVHLDDEGDDEHNLEGYGKNRAPLLLLLVAASIGSYGFSEGAINLKQRPVLVAASIGSYGAYLADGSEYSGNYGQEITVEIVKDFHRRRLEVLSEAGADIIAFETIPNKLEAQAYVELLLECDTKIPAWFSFTSKDGINVVSGDSMAECVSLADSCNKVVAIGINCTAPRFIHNLILSIKKLNAQFRRNPSLIQNLTTY
ncbi:homocysteine S-methyltransferase 2-like [Zingiber officinale]|uniref:homocysteine S-methyltransferase 2-like n=1 Tax=Zingiber officinale TaxID=94328 RepID=UPI001C4BF6A3|nr:homocysteine S-methyltransferase 2-like [Zingiber officinale]